jgi:hypothetical protein
VANSESKNGARDRYWVATAAARTRGYLPRTVRLHYDLGGSAGRHDLEQHCRARTNEMLAWPADPADTRKPIYDGTRGALISCYQTDQKSPYRGLAQNTRRVYDDWCRTLDRAIGKRRVDRGVCGACI